MARFKVEYFDCEAGKKRTFETGAKNVLSAYYGAEKYICAVRNSHFGALIGEDGTKYYFEDIEKYGRQLKRLVLLSGPSCAGKTPLRKVLEEIVDFNRAILHTSRDKKDNEVDGVDYHFDSEEYIKSLIGNPRYIVGRVRDMWQAIDLNDLDFRKGVVFVEAYHTLGAQLRTGTYLPDDVAPVSVFMSPLNSFEIQDLGSTVDRHLVSLMGNKMVVRENASDFFMLDNDVQDKIITKARDVPSEMQSAHKYSCVLVNHDGECHPNWKNLEGDAGRSVEAMTRILNCGIYRSYANVWFDEGELRSEIVVPNPKYSGAIQYWTEETMPD